MIVLDTPTESGFNKVFPLFFSNSDKIKAFDYDKTRKNSHLFLFINSIFAIVFLTTKNLSNDYAGSVLFLASIGFVFYIWARIKFTRHFVTLDMSQATAFRIAGPEIWAEHISLCTCFVFGLRFAVDNDDFLVRQVGLLLTSMFVLWSFAPVVCVLLFWLRRGGGRSA